MGRAAAYPERMSATDQTTDSPVNCSHCGITVESAPVTWVYEVGRHGIGGWICDRCARTNLRSIEAKLDQEWW